MTSVHESLVVVLVGCAVLISFSLSDCIRAITAWLKHDLKMRKGNRE
jgi:hypothetical protein